jgi:putative cell wall-binding protein
MIHTAGVERAKVNTILTFKEKYPNLSDDFSTFLCQGIDYVAEQMTQNVQ